MLIEKVFGTLTRVIITFKVLSRERFNRKQMFCVQLLTSDNQNQCRNKMAAYEVDYFRLTYRTLRTETHEINCVTIVATYSYLLTNFVSNFHVKFHQNQLKLSSNRRDLLKQLERCGVVTWLVCIFRGLRLSSLIYRKYSVSEYLPSKQTDGSLRTNRHGTV